MIHGADPNYLGRKAQFELVVFTNVSSWFPIKQKHFVCLDGKDSLHTWCRMWLHMRRENILKCIISNLSYLYDLSQVFNLG